MNNQSKLRAMYAAIGLAFSMEAVVTTMISSKNNDNFTIAQLLTGKDGNTAAFYLLSSAALVNATLACFPGLENNIKQFGCDIKNYFFNKDNHPPTEIAVINTKHDKKRVVQV